MLRLWRLALVLLALGVVLADTEIRNFHLPLSGERATPTGRVIRITPEQRQLELSVSRSQPELWVALDTGPSGAWTTRLSWAASTPTKFDMDIYASENNDGAGLLHIRARPLSPRMPHPLLARFGLADPAPKLLELNDIDLDTMEFETPFHLVLEPLVLGVPRTAGSAVAGVLVMAALAALCVPRAISALDRLVGRLKAEEAAKQD